MRLGKRERLKLKATQSRRADWKGEILAPKYQSNLARLWPMGKPSRAWGYDSEYSKSHKLRNAAKARKA